MQSRVNFRKALRWLRRPAGAVSGSSNITTFIGVAGMPCTVADSGGYSKLRAVALSVLVEDG